MTPQVPNGGRKVSAALIASKGTKADGSKAQVPLESQAQHWPTPSAAVMNDGESPETWRARAEKLKAKKMNGNGAGLPLTVAAVEHSWQWPTPASRDYRSPNMESLESRGGGSKGEQRPNYVAHHFSPPAPNTQPGATSSPSGPNLHQRLNPIFVAWLMGWPLAWLIAEPRASSAAATASWHCALQSQLSFFFGEQE